jgi:hypothetical protein
MHQREQIRQAIFTLLQPHPLLNKLFVTRTKPTAESKLPFANVMSGTEVSEDLTDNWLEFRTLQVHVLLYVQQSPGVADALDNLAEAVENLLSKDQTLGGVCSKFRYKGCEPDYDSAVAQESALLTMNYEVEYVWEPTINADPLTTINVEVDMASPRNDPQVPATPDGQIDAVIEILLPQ